MGLADLVERGNWLNEPLVWNSADGDLTIETDSETDFWQETLYGFHRDNGHALLMPVRGNFTAIVSFEADYETLYDQAGLLLRLGPRQWMKAGVEYNDGTPNMSVVVTRKVSDWSTTPLPAGLDRQRLRLTRLGEALILQFRNAENRWQLLRVADFSTDADLSIGPMACSPQRAGLRARFFEFSVGAAVATPLHDDSPADQEFAISA